MRKKIIGLAGWLALCFGAGATGSVATAQARAFYSQLAQPAWAPPGWVFGPVWTVLYALMGISAWLIWKEGGFRAHGAPLGLFLGQLVLNALWSWLFFAWRLGGLSFINILALLGMLTLVLTVFWRIRRLAGILLIPYLLWVAFASALNFAIWQLNPHLLAGTFG